MPTVTWLITFAAAALSMSNPVTKAQLLRDGNADAGFLDAVMLINMPTTPPNAQLISQLPATIMKVMSFNLRTTLARDPCPNGCWDQRQWRIKDMLARYDPDLIGTQEDAPDQTAFFTQTLGYQAFGDCAGDCNRNERNSIFYKPSKWQFLEGQTFALSDTPEIIPSNTWNLEYLRDAVLARFQHIATGNMVCMLNTHYDISRGQPQSSILVAKRMANFCKRTDIVVMTGDLNTVPWNDAIKYLSGDATLYNQRTPIPLFETLTACGAGGGTWIGGSFDSTIRGDKLDYIFTRRDAQTCVQDAKIITDLFGGFSVSDHAVVQTNFCMGSGCTNCK